MKTQETLCSSCAGGREVVQVSARTSFHARISIRFSIGKMTYFVNVSSAASNVTFSRRADVDAAFPARDPAGFFRIRCSSFVGPLAGLVHDSRVSSGDDRSRGHATGEIARCPVCEIATQMRISGWRRIVRRRDRRRGPTPKTPSTGGDENCICSSLACSRAVVSTAAFLSIGDAAFPRALRASRSTMSIQPTARHRPFVSSRFIPARFRR